MLFLTGNPYQDRVAAYPPRAHVQYVEMIPTNVRMKALLTKDTLSQK